MRIFTLLNKIQKSSVIIFYTRCLFRKMSAPLKPWEQRTSVQHQQMMNLSSSAPTMQMLQTPVGRVRSTGGLPQLPPRPGVSSYGSSPYSYMGGMGGMFMNILF